MEISKISCGSREIDLPRKIEVDIDQNNMGDEEIYFLIYEAIIQEWEKDLYKLSLYRSLMDNSMNANSLIERIIELENNKD